MENRRVAKPRAFSTTTKLTEDTQVMGFNGVIFGKPGVGKTTLALTAQGSKYGGNVLLHDADQGRESVLDVEGAEYYVPKNWQELRDNMDTAVALKDDSPFQTHVFDSLSSIYYEHLFPAMERKLSNKDGRAIYGEAGKELIKFVRDARNLAEYGINTIFLGHEKEEEKEGTTYVRLSLPPGIRNDILLVVNHIGYLARAKRSEDRELHLAPPNPRTDGPKVRQTKSGPKVETVISNPNIGDLITQLREK